MGAFIKAFICISDIGMSDSVKNRMQQLRRQAVSNPVNADNISVPIS
jgi:hypothetical protein